MLLNIKQEVLDIIEKKYKILQLVDFVYYDYRMDELDHLLAQYKNYSFSPNEKLIFLHHDTDYYNNVNSIGNIIYNLFSILNTNSIAQESCIFVTNHFGIKKEIETVSKLKGNHTPMKVIYTVLWYDYPDTIETSIKFKDLSSLYCCLNGVQRSHRIYTLCCLQKNNLIDKGMVSYHFKK